VLAVGNSGDQACLLQALQPIGEQVGGNTLRRGEKLPIAALAAQQVPEDEQGPAIAHQVKRSCNRAGVNAVPPCAVWVAFVAALAVSLTGLLRTDPSGVPIPIGLALLTPLVLGVLAYLRSRPFRRVLSTVNLRWLIGVRLWRVLGAEFLVAYAHNQLPASFAIPAGVGDLPIGLAAPPVAMIATSGTLMARRIVLVWCIAGIADLVLAVTMGAQRTRPLRPDLLGCPWLSCCTAVGQALRQALPHRARRCRPDPQDLLGANTRCGSPTRRSSAAG
jgi:hypothetical protein